MMTVLKSVLERVPAAKRAEGETPANLWEEWREALQARAKASGKEEATPEEPRLGLPGSGSDFAVFVHHLNIPCLEPGFGGGKGGGGYHTTFDDFLYVEKHVDPGFVGHELAGTFYAELLADLADRGAFFDDAEAARELARRAREAASESSIAGPLATSFQRVAESFDKLVEFLGPEQKRTHNVQLRIAKGNLFQSLAVPEGLAGRSWFRNRLWAPGLEDGYGSETFPSLRAAQAQGQEALDAETEALVKSVEFLAL